MICTDWLSKSSYSMLRGPPSCSLLTPCSLAQRSASLSGGRCGGPFSRCWPPAGGQLPFLGARSRSMRVRQPTGGGSSGSCLAFCPASALDRSRPARWGPLGTASCAKHCLLAAAAEQHTLLTRHLLTLTNALCMGMPTSTCWGAWHDP